MGAAGWTLPLSLVLRVRFSPSASRKPTWVGYRSHFSNEEAETQRGHVACQRRPRLVSGRARISAQSSLTPRPVSLSILPKERCRLGATA